MHVGSVVGALLLRELSAVRRELEAYPDEALIWALPPGLENSAGTLVLHLAGNLQHYIGRHLGGTGYVRDRPAEFRRRGVPRAELLLELECAAAAVGPAARAIDAERLDVEFPEPVGDVRVSSGELLVHLLSHCAYHLGQIDYHRRVVTGIAAGVGAVRLSELPTARSAAG